MYVGNRMAFWENFLIISSVIMSKPAEFLRWNFITLTSSSPGGNARGGKDIGIGESINCVTSTILFGERML